MTKVVAGQSPEVTETFKQIYGAITSGGVYVARDIKTAEAAEAANVIENAQRDISIAFVNEVTQIFHKLGISSHDVLDAATTKWNFLDFRPGLVGGHCIGVDPFYLAHRAREVGHEPEIILAGRRINDGMGRFVADEVAKRLEAGRVLVLGVTFKEKVTDMRNTRVVDVISGLRGHGLDVDAHDPLADPNEAAKLCGGLPPQVDDPPARRCLSCHRDYHHHDRPDRVDIHAARDQSGFAVACLSLLAQNFRIQRVHLACCIRPQFADCSRQGRPSESRVVAPPRMCSL